MAVAAVVVSVVLAVVLLAAVALLFIDPREWVRDEAEP